MATRYVDRQGYVEAAAEAADRAVSAGLLLPPDAERIRAAASLQWDALGDRLKRSCFRHPYNSGDSRFFASGFFRGDLPDKFQHGLFPLRGIRGLADYSLPHVRQGTGQRLSGG